ncbi:MAG: lysophospholipid acyltransferase family protein [Candidatus Omnitrophota bacterium]
MKVLMRVRIYGEENFPEPPFIVTSNHVSLMDPPLVGLACRKYPVNFMAKRELFSAPIIGAWTSRVKCIPVDRGKNSIRGIREAIRRLKRGAVIGVFPEGGRSITGELQEAKLGTGLLIIKAKVPVVPVYVYGSSEAFPKGKGLRLGTRVGAIVGKPIPPEEFSSMEGTGREGYEAISTLVMEKIAQLKES